MTPGPDARLDSPRHQADFARLAPTRPGGALPAHVYRLSTRKVDRNNQIRSNQLLDIMNGTEILFRYHLTL